MIEESIVPNLNYKFTRPLNIGVEFIIEVTTSNKVFVENYKVLDILEDGTVKTDKVIPLGMVLKKECDSILLCNLSADVSVQFTYTHTKDKPIIL